MISREQARAIAESAVLARGAGEAIREVRELAELTGRAPTLYNGPDVGRCWIAYVDRPVCALQSSRIVLMDRQTGVVLYVGSANDEG